MTPALDWDVYTKACEDTLAKKSVISDFRYYLDWNVCLQHQGYYYRRSFGISKELFKSVRSSLGKNPKTNFSLTIHCINIKM